MIISAGRRTDILRFYFECFLKRLADGFVLVRNPVNFWKRAAPLFTGCG